MAAKQESSEDTRLNQAALLALTARVGMLATVDGTQPYASLVTPAFGPEGAPILLLSSLSVHTKHLTANPACSLLLTGQPQSENPQTTPRLTLSGHAASIDDPLTTAAFLRAHPYAALYAGFTDFAYWRLIITSAHYIGGFAAAFHLNPAALQHAIITRTGPYAVDAAEPDGYD